MSTTYAQRQRQIATRWKAATLAPEAQAPGPYAGRGSYPFCLPLEHADQTLLPEVRQAGLDLFAELGIPWHRGVAGGPTNHLLSSQVQCVNALMPMVSDPMRIVRAFGDRLDIAELLEIEPGRFLTFEYVSSTDYLSESKDGLRVRGANCTCVDAAFTYVTSTGTTELALVEWKYTECYSTPHDPAKTPTRAARYQHLVQAPGSPIRQGVPFEWLLDEPFYQLMRQQLLAHAIETDPAMPYDVVRVVHVLDPANAAYQASITNPLLRKYGDSVDDVWAWLLTAADRFSHVAPAVFLNPGVTSADYVHRYS